MNDKSAMQLPDVWACHRPGLAVAGYYHPREDPSQIATPKPGEAGRADASPDPKRPPQPPPAAVWSAFGGLGSQDRPEAGRKGRARWFLKVLAFASSLKVWLLLKSKLSHNGTVFTASTLFCFGINDRPHPDRLSNRDAQDFRQPLAVRRSSPRRQPALAATAARNFKSSWSAFAMAIPLL